MRNDHGAPRARASARVPLLALALLLFAGLPGAAQEKFRGIDVEPASGVYEVIVDANVRDGPSTRSARIGSLKLGAKVEAVGVAPGDWLAVLKDGKPFGFVYAPLLKQIVTAALEKDAQGNVLDAEGAPVEPASGFFMVLKDVNIRHKPTTTSTRRGKLEKGARVEAFGEAADGEWLVVRRGEQELGFVIAELLLPLIDGALDADISGRARMADGGACDYIIRFEGKTEVDEGLFETADYDLRMRCDFAGAVFGFRTPMFITEAPYRLTHDLVHQISVDLIEIAAGYDELLSTTVLYRRGEGLVVFDGLSLETYGEAPAITEMPAASFEEALAAAVEMAVAAWNDKVWEVLSGAAKR